MANHDSVSSKEFAKMLSEITEIISQGEIEPMQACELLRELIKQTEGCSVNDNAFNPFRTNDVCSASVGSAPVRSTPVRSTHNHTKEDNPAEKPSWADKNTAFAKKLSSAAFTAPTCRRWRHGKSCDTSRCTFSHCHVPCKNGDGCEYMAKGTCTGVHLNPPPCPAFYDSGACPRGAMCSMLHECE